MPGIFTPAEVVIMSVAADVLWFPAFMLWSPVSHGVNIIRDRSMNGKRGTGHFPEIPIRGSCGIDRMLPRFGLSGANPVASFAFRPVQQRI